LRPGVIAALLAASLLSTVPFLRAGTGTGNAICNVKNYGATGRKADDAKAAIQKAVDACAQAVGGVVDLPPGEYTSGTIHLRSNVTFYIESGATLFADRNEHAYDVDALLYGEDVHQISIEGRGVVEGQSEYVWRMNDMTDYFILDNQLAAQAAGVPLMRSFPKDLGKRKLYPHLIQLIGCKDVKIMGLSFLHSPSWSINPVQCERLRIDGIYVSTDQKYGVWADGIDPDGCKDVVIANSTIETGDDAIVFYSMNWHNRPPLPCENITITNCRLSSSSSAIKFCDGNMNAVRNVTISNCVITNSNRGIAFMVYDGGVVENIIISNIVVNTVRFDWFWWGNGDPIYFIIKRRGENEGKTPGPNDPPAGKIRNVIVRNVIAHGKGSCLILGHPDSPLENVSLENIKLFLSSDLTPGYDKSVHAMYFHYAKNLTVKDLQVNWEKPESAKWQSPLYFEDVKGLRLDGFTGVPAKPDLPAIVLDKVEGATITNSRALPGTPVFLKVTNNSRDIYLVGNELHAAGTPFQLSGANEGAVTASNNF
jgi:hypothetical protein